MTAVPVDSHRPAGNTRWPETRSTTRRRAKVRHVIDAAGAKAGPAALDVSRLQLRHQSGSNCSKSEMAGGVAAIEADVFLRRANQDAAHRRAKPGSAAQRSPAARELAGRNSTARSGRESA